MREPPDSAPRFHIAQLNVGRAVAPLDSPAMAPFVALLDTINAAGEATAGFVWRLQGDGGNAMDVQVSDDPRLIVNLTVWEAIEQLLAFTYRSEHGPVYARRREWFEVPAAPTLVLWWVPAGTLPTAAEAMARLALLRELGPTPDAFTFKQRFPPPAGDSP